MANIRITFSTDGADQVQKDATKVFAAIENTSKSLISLSKSLGVNAQEAESFAKSLGIGTVAADKVVKAFKDMESVGASLEQNFGYLNQELDVTSEQFQLLTQGLNVATKESEAFAEEQSRLNTFADAFSKTVTQLNTPLTQFETDLKESANAAIKLRETISSVGDVSSLSEVAEAAGKSSLAMEKLSVQLNTSEKETRKVIASTIDFSKKLNEVSTASGRSGDELRGLIDSFKEGNISLAEFATELKTTKELALKFATEIDEDTQVMAQFSKQVGIAENELVSIVTSIKAGDQSFGELLDALENTNIGLKEFIDSFDSAELSIKAIAIATKSTEEEIKGFIKDIDEGDRVISEFAQAMNVSEKEVLELVQSYIGLQYGSEQLNRSTQSLASSFHVVEKALEPIPKAIEKVDDAADKSADGIDNLGDTIDETSKEFEDSFGLIEEKSQELLNVLFGFGSEAVSSFAKFDSALRQSAVVGGLTEQDVVKLTDAVIQLGVETSASPTDVAKMTSSLSRAGFTASEQIVALEGMIRAAEATGEEFSVLSDVIGNTVRTFGLSADEANRVADVLVSAANNTNTSVGQLGEGFAYVGTQAVQSNQSVEEVAITLGLLADTGLEGSAGGTALAEALRRLSLASAGANSEFTELIRGNEKMVGAFQSLNLDIRDTNGQLLPLTQLLPIVKNSFDQLASQQDKEIIANALFGVQGGRGFLSVMDQVDTRLQTVSLAVQNSAGTAKEAGAEILDGISGSLDVFGSTVDTFNIKLGEFVSGGLEPVVQGATSLINSFLELNPAIQQVVFGVGSLATALTAAVVVVTLYNTLQVKATIAAFADSAAKVKQAIANFGVTASLVSLNTALGNSIKAMYGSATAATTVGATAGGAAVGIGSLTAAFTGALKLLGVVGGALLRLTVLVGPVIAAVASLKLAAASFEASTKSAREADDAIADLESSYNTYANTVGLSTIQIEESIGVFGRLGNAIGGVIEKLQEAGSAIGDAAYNFNIADFIPDELESFLERVIPGIEEFASAAEADANRLAASSSNINVALNELNTTFTNFKIQGKLGSDAAQGLAVSLQKAKDAILLMQEAGIANGNVSSDQLAIWALQQQSLTGMIDQLNAAKTQTDNLAEAESNAIDITEQLAEAMNKLGDELESALTNIDKQVLEATIAANEEFIDNAEQREATIANIESTAIDQRIAVIEAFIEKRKALSGLSAEQEIENQEEIATLEIDLLNLRLQESQDAIKIREEAEKEFAETQKAFAQQVYDRKKILLDQETNDLNQALDDRIAAENAAIEVLDDRSDLLNQELNLLNLLGDQSALIYAGREQDLNRQIEALGQQNQTIDQQIEKLKQTGASQSEIAALEERKILNANNILVLEEAKRVAAEEQLKVQQAIEQQQLLYQQELTRLDLDRQVRQAQINAIESEREVIQARQLAKSNELELSEQRRLFNLAKINEASEAEIIALQGQIDAATATLALSQESVVLAQQAAQLSKDEVTDAELARAKYEEISQVEAENLRLKQANERAQLANTNEASRTADQLARGSQEADGLASSADGAASAIGGAADQGDRLTGSLGQARQEAGLLEQSLVAAGRALSDFQKQQLAQSLPNQTFDSSGKNTTLAKREIGGLGNQYFVGGKEVSEFEYNAAASAGNPLGKKSKGGTTTYDLPSSLINARTGNQDDIEAAIKDLSTKTKDELIEIKNEYDRYATNLENLYAQLPGVNVLEFREQLQYGFDLINDARKKLLEPLVLSTSQIGGTAIEGRAVGGDVKRNQPYIVGERGRELFIPNQSGTIVPNSLLTAPTLPGSYSLSPTASTGGADSRALVLEIQGLRQDLANRPVPAVESNVTFVNEPNPLEAQIRLLQGQLRAGRSL